MLQKNPVDEQIGDGLLYFREKSGYSRELFAGKIGVMVEQLEMWELGYARIPAEQLCSISHLLDVKPSVFFHSFHNAENNTENGAANRLRGHANIDNSEIHQLVRMVVALKNIQDMELRNSLIIFAEILTDAPQSGKKTKTPSRHILTVASDLLTVASDRVP